jgi:hypothetical protein
MALTGQQKRKLFEDLIKSQYSPENVRERERMSASRAARRKQIEEDVKRFTEALGMEKLPDDVRDDYRSFLQGHISNGEFLGRLALNHPDIAREVWKRQPSSKVNP